MFDFHPKKLILMLVCLIIALVGSDFLIHQIILKQDYADTAQLWRPPSEMAGKMPFMFLGEILSALIFGMLFARGFASGNWTCALIYGFMFGLLMAATSLTYYSVMPLPASLAIKWSVFGILQGLLLACIAKLVYGRGPIDETLLKQG